MSIAVVLLHYNRWPNLRLCLRALKEQTLTRSEFHVVVADDGSTDETVAELRREMALPEWEGHLHMVSGGPHNGARLSRIHNIGIANIPSDCTFFVLLASDMCLAPDALEQIANLHQQHPQAVMITRLDWLPPKSHAELEAIWDERGFEGLWNEVPQTPIDWVEHTLVGQDTRPLRETATLEPFDSYPFNPVYCLPTELFWRIGGFDEEMVSYGWQELEFAIRIEQQKVDMITSMEIRCLHIWHPKDAEIRELVPWQRQESTAYILRKHGPQKNPLSYRNWKYWRHYQRVQGGTVIYVVDGASGLYVMNDTRSHCLRLPHAGWLHPLGFAMKDVVFVHADILSLLSYEGWAEDPLNECEFSTLIEDLETLLAARVEAWRGEQDQNPPMPDIQPKLEALLHEYEAAKIRADLPPGASVPVVRAGMRAFKRVSGLGRVWAAERKLFLALIEAVSQTQQK